MSIEAMRQAREVFGEVLETLKRAAPGTPLNNHRFDGLGIRAYAAIAALDAALAATPKPLDDPRLQGLFSDAISGALAFGAQNTNPPPAGHWLERFWQMGRAERALSEATTPAPEAPTAPAGIAWWQTAKDCGCWADKTDGDMGYVHFGSTEAMRVFVVKITAQAYKAGQLAGPPIVNKFGDTLKPEWQSFMQGAVAKAQGAAPEAQALLTDEQIVAIRDDHLPSQGERFDCIDFARAIEREVRAALASPTPTAESKDAALRESLKRLWPLIERGTKGFVFTAAKAGEVAADMAVLRDAASTPPSEPT
jgi:hypothetical protein